MTKQILLSLLNCSWQWMLLIGLIWFVVSPPFHKSRRSNTTIHLLWLLSLLSLPILFGLNQFVPAPSIGSTMPELVQAEPIDVSGLAALTTDLPEISSTASDAQSKNQLFAGGKSFVDWESKTDLLLCIWAIGALTMLIRFLFGLYRIHQLRCSAVVADDSYQAICQRLVRRLSVKRPVTVCFSDQVASPISFGWLSPYILIPRKLNLEQFELVAAHELAHVQRLDWLTNLFSHLIGVIFFFHPIYHFLNRELVRVRERICDDWVIRLTGARKNYAQCLLDLVGHEDRIVPLALSLNQPSQLESRIDSILKSNRRLDVQLKPRSQLMVATLLLTCLPLLAMAQLAPLKTFQVSLFAQTPQKSEKRVNKTDKKQVMQKAKAGKMDGKQYKDDSYIKVKDPVLFAKSEENKIFSGPQPGEKLPPLTVTGIGGRIDGTMFDITTKADGKPLVLFLQDTNGVGVKGLVNVFELLLQIDTFQKKHGKATGVEKSNEGLQIGVVFLADNLDTLPEWARDMLRKEIPNEVLTGISPDGREGPGSYGLNRNVAQTVLIAKDGKVIHNFAFTQPMLYADPYFLGAIAQAIEVEPATLEKRLNEEGEWLTGDENTNPTSATVEKWLNEEPAEGTRMERGGEQMEREGARDRGRTPSREALVKRFDKDGDGKLNREEGMAARRALAERESQNRNRNARVEVKNPTEFKKTQEKEVFSGPQLGEKLPSLQATGVYGEIEGETFDFIAKADGRAHVLFLQDESRVGLRGLVSVAGVVDKISNRSDKDLHISVVFLSDDSDALKKTVIGIARRVPENVFVGISPDGREGPGSYGLNRNVAQTVIIAKDGKVLHNFAFTQPMLRPDPYLLGAIGDAIGIKPATLEKWLNEKGLVIKINNPTASDKMGKMLLNGAVVQSDEMISLLLNLPEEQKSMLTIQPGRDVPHEQIVTVMDIAKKAGIDQIEFATDLAEGDRMQRAFVGQLREMIEKGEITGEEARELRELYETLEKWLNVRNLTIVIKKPTEGEKTGEMLLNGNIVQFDELGSRLLNLPEEQKFMLTIQSGRDVPHEQIVKVMDIAKKAGIDQIGFAIDSAEGDRMQRAFVGQLREMIEKGEITGEEARELYEKAFPRRKED